MGGTVRSATRPDKWRVSCESELPDGWTISAAFGLRDGRVRMVEPPKLIPPPGQDTIEGLKGAMRRLRMGWVSKEWEAMLEGHYLELPQEWRDGFRESPRPGRAGHPIEFYALWVQRYVDACERSSRPTADLIREFPNETAQSISRYLDKAGVLQLITDRPGRGKAGGTMTDKCRQILEGADQ